MMADKWTTKGLNRTQTESEFSGVTVLRGSYEGKGLTSQIYSELGLNSGEDGVKGYTIQSERTLLRALILTGQEALPVVMCKFQTSTEF